MYVRGDAGVLIGNFPNSRSGSVTSTIFALGHRQGIVANVEVRLIPACLLKNCIDDVFEGDDA